MKNFRETLNILLRESRKIDSKISDLTLPTPFFQNDNSALIGFCIKGKKILMRFGDSVTSRLHEITEAVTGQDGLRRTTFLERRDGIVPSVTEIYNDGVNISRRTFTEIDTTTSPQITNIARFDYTPKNPTPRETAEVRVGFKVVPNTPQAFKVFTYLN